MDALRSQSRTRRDYSRIVRTGGQFFLQALEGNTDPNIRFVEIGIADSGGINCKVRGVLVRGTDARQSDNRMVHAVQQSLKGASSNDQGARKALEFMATLQSHAVFASPPPFAEPKVYESIHPYSDSQNDHKQPTHVKVEGADHYEITFDPLCCTAASIDTLVFSVKGEPLPDGLYCGPEGGDGWRPLVISGEEFEFKFVVASGDEQYGYKFTVVPKKDRLNLSRFGDSLHDSLALAVCQLCISDSGTFDLPFTMTADGEIVESNLIPILQACLSRCMQHDHIRSAVERAIAMIFVAGFDRSDVKSVSDSDSLGSGLRCGTLLMNLQVFFVS